MSSVKTHRVLLYICIAWDVPVSIHDFQKPQIFVLCILGKLTLDVTYDQRKESDHTLAYLRQKILQN